MWKNINDEKDIDELLLKVNYFHDSCIRKISYVSGAYVDEDLAMHPVNDDRVLTIVFDSQFENCRSFELEFEKVKFMKLMPASDGYTCEILGATLVIKDDLIYWADGEVPVENIPASYNGTVICAEDLRWRIAK